MKPIQSGDLEGLPHHFHQERAVLLQAGITSWEQLGALPSEKLRALARPGAASEARLLRLRAQARLMAEANLAPHEAALLLHAGIAEVRGLAEADPQRLLVQLHRLCVRLLGPAAVPPSLATVRGWIRSAATSRSAN